MERIAGSILLFCLISLTNANSSPEITGTLYEVCEDTPVGQPGFTITASDPDGDTLTYTLIGTNAPNFRVEESTGVASVARPLDRESSQGYLLLEAGVSDGVNYRTGVLTIILLDANDNKPNFQSPSYDTSVPENTPVGTTLFKASATDDDTGTAGIITYAIDEVIPNDGFSLFSIVRESGDVKLIKPLNYTSLSTYYRLKINASDGGGKCYKSDPEYLSSIVYSFVTVEDVPDLDPQFIGVPYVGSVREHSPVDTSVLKVTAVDPDIGVSDAISYSIEESSADGLFKISTSDGVISVLSEVDREVIGDTVTLTVKVHFYFIVNFLLSVYVTTVSLSISTN